MIVNLAREAGKGNKMKAQPASEVAGAVATIGAYLAAIAGHDLPAGVEAALATIFASLVYRARDTTLCRREGHGQ